MSYMADGADMGAAVFHMEQDAYEGDQANAGYAEQEWRPDSEDLSDEQEDGDASSDEDYGPSKRRKTPTKPRSSSKAAAAVKQSSAVPQRRKRAKREADSDEEEGYGAGTSAAAEAYGRPRRQAAQRAEQAMQQAFDDDEEEPDERPTRRRRKADSDESDPAASDFDVFDDADEDGTGDDDSDDDADEALARQLHEEMNGLRAKRPARGKSGASPPSERPPRAPSRARTHRTSTKTGSGRAATSSGARRNSTQRTSGRAVAKVSYVESEGDSDSEGYVQAKKPRKELPSALEDPGEERQDEIERVLGHRDSAEAFSDPAAEPWATKEFRIKWKRYSYTHCTWESLDTLRQLPGFKRVANYMRRADEVAAVLPRLSREERELLDVERQMEEQLYEQYKQVERIVSERPSEDRCYLVKWEGLPYAEATWETERTVLDAPNGLAQRDLFQERQQRLLEPAKGVDAQRSAYASKKKSIGALDVQPEFLKFGQLRDYQLHGLNWLTYSWLQDRNCILADEMGLGKTVQCVSFLGLLSETLQVRGPFLVVVPLSTVPNWIREFRRWVPMVNAVVYVGDSQSREVIREFEFGVERGSKARQYRFEVLLTTYELILKDAHVLGRIKWNYMMVDEAHRLKNSESALYQELITWHFKNKLLVTGTPLQNSIKELWALMHFLEPATFPDSAEFEELYSTDNADSVSELHTVLRPHLLRRIIKDVERSLPPKNERILRVEMSPLQKQYYKWILARNFKELNKGLRGGHVSLLNVIGELKKCCNHPFLFESAEEGYRGSDTDKSAVDRLIVTSGKMVLLDKLMRRLRDTGHRVLIFSQMVRVLDIISDYMRLRGFPHQRLDGSTPAAARHQAMEHFNAPESSDFAFLLSTRAGGLGINLATADTVIIFDSDWNPQNDLQAMSRAHRIGQTETVNIYRFVTSSSVEEDILERAKQKMVLDHLVIQRMDTSGRTVVDSSKGSSSSAKAMFGKEELAAILRFGAEDLFKSEAENAEREKAMYEEDIDAILERAEVVDTSAVRQSETGGATELLNAFNVATFKNEEDDATFWSRLIPVSELEKQEEQADLLPRAARLKPEDRAALGLGPASSDDDADPATATGATVGGSGAKGRSGGKGGRKERKSGGRKNVSGAEPGPAVDGASLRIDEWLLDVDETGRPVAKQDAAEGADAPPTNIRTISRRDATVFVRAARRYGLLRRLPDVASEVGGAVEEAPPPAQMSLFRSLVDGCKRAVEMTEEEGQDAKDAMLDFFGTAVKAQELLTHFSTLKLLAKRIDTLTSANQEPARSFRLDAASLPAPPKWGKSINWVARDDAMLLLGVHWHGLGHWEAIAEDGRLGLGEKLASAVGKAAAGKEDVAGEGGKAAGKEDADKLLPKASHLETRVLGILRKMHAANKASTGASRQSTLKQAFTKGATNNSSRPRPGARPQDPARAGSGTFAGEGRDKGDRARAGPGAFAGEGRDKADRARAGPSSAAGGEGRDKGERAASGAAAGASGHGVPGAHRASPLNAPSGAKRRPEGDAGAAGTSGAADGPKRPRPSPPDGSTANGSGAHHHQHSQQQQQQQQRGSGSGGAGGASGSGRSAAAAGAGAGSGPLDKAEAQELLAPVAKDVKKLLLLKQDDTLQPQQVLERTRKYLFSIGQQVEAAVASKGAGVRLPLWDFVAKYTKQPFQGDKMEAMYLKVKALKAGAGDGASRPTSSLASTAGVGPGSSAAARAGGGGGRSRSEPSAGGHGHHSSSHHSGAHDSSRGGPMSHQHHQQHQRPSSQHDHRSHQQHGGHQRPPGHTPPPGHPPRSTPPPSHR